MKNEHKIIIFNDRHHHNSRTEYGKNEKFVEIRGKERKSSHDDDINVGLYKVTKIYVYTHMHVF